MTSPFAKIPPLFEHQAAGVEFEGLHPRVADFSDPGTGKTRVRLEAFAKRRSNGGKCMLVLAPKSILDNAWAADAAKYVPWLSVSCAYAENREKAFAKSADIYVTNHDAVKWLAKQPPSFFERFSDLVIDESGAYKHHTSKRSKAVAKIKGHFKHRVIMNGTPNTNGICDVWHQVNILDDGERLGKSFFKFRSVMCQPQQVGPSANMLKWHDRDGVEEVVAEMIRDIIVRNKLNDCVDIPANHSYVVPFSLTAGNERNYREMERSAILRLDDLEISGVNAAAVINKLLQIASGAVYDSETEYHLLDTSRYELVMDLAEQRRHSVVFFNWVHQRDELVKEAKRRGVTHAVIDGSVTSRHERKRIVDFYQAGMYRVLFAHPQTAAHGLTLTRGTGTIWSSPTYNLEHWIQGNHRIDRAGQTEKTETINVIATGTIEEHVYGVLTGKFGKLSSMLDYLKAKKVP